MILTGGAVVFIYSDGKYVSKDADFLSMTDHQNIKQAMFDLGFKNLGKDFYHIGFAGLDVYEEEEGLFFENLSEEILEDDQLARLLTFPNVIITSHQAFLTHEALSNIARTTLQNVADFESGIPLKNALTTDIPVPRAPV